MAQNEQNTIRDYDPYEYQKNEFGKVGFPFERIKATPETYADVFSEGSPALKKLLLHLWAHDIETKACCTGHAGVQSFTKNTLFGQKAVDFEEWLAHKNSRRYHRWTKDVPAYLSFKFRENNDPKEISRQLQEELTKECPDLPFSVSYSSDSISVHLKHYVLPHRIEQFFSAVSVATSQALSLQFGAPQKEIPGANFDIHSRDFAKKERDSQLDKCLEGQPFEVRSFMERFQPANEKESALYNYMVKIGHIDDVSLATIADSSLIHHLWENHQDSQDYNIRKTLMENPRCSRSLIEQGLSDQDWEVRKASVQRPELSQEACIQHAKREGNLTVQQALRERLGALYPTQPDSPVPMAAMQAQAKTPEGRVVAVHAGRMPMRKPSLASMVQSADARQKAQAAAREYTPGIQHKPEGR